MTELLTIKVATAAESDDVAQIGRTTFYETWKDENTEKDMQQYMKESFDVKKIKNDLLNTADNLFLLAFAGNHLVGYAKLRRDRTYDEFKGTKAIEIERIYVKKEFQKMKIGKLMMDQCIEIANIEGHEWLWLGVNKENNKAIDFYKRYGFEIFGTKFFKLGNAEDEDFLMKLKLR